MKRGPDMLSGATGITLAQLAASGRHIVVLCAHCQNRTLSRTSELNLPLNLRVNQVGALLKCGACGSMDVLVFPESDRDARRGRVR